MVKIIPVKVLMQNGNGWSSVIACGITYVADLKAGPLADYPVVINMSLAGPVLDPAEQEAIDYAIEKGGARFFEDLRKQVGDEIFFKFLKDYYTQYSDKRATGADFFRVFHENTAADITELLVKYFQNTY